MVMTSVLNQNSANSTASKSQPNSVHFTPSKTHSSALNLTEIQKLLPHRYPFLLVDRIIEYVPGKSAVGIKNITFNEPQFQGHFPKKPIMPGVLIIKRWPKSVALC